MSNDGSLTVDVNGKVSTITFAHPSHNSIPSQLASRITQVILQEGKNDGSKIILLKSAGDRTFCAGANFRELAAIETLENGKSFFSSIAQIILAIKNCNKIVIGRAQGKAVGGGVGLLAATDYCVGTKWSEIRLSELSIGIGPYVIEPSISRKIGTAGFSKLALEPTQWHSPSWAMDQGIYNHVFDNSKSMDEYLEGYLKTMTAYDSTALKNMKHLIWQNTDHWNEILDARALQSAKLLLSEQTQTFLKNHIATGS